MTHRHNLGRSEKYHALPRTLYALLFDDGGCYIGQSSNPHQREKQHRSRQGGWHRPFQFHTHPARHRVERGLVPVADSLTPFHRR